MDHQVFQDVAFFLNQLFGRGLGLLFLVGAGSLED